MHKSIKKAALAAVLLPFAAAACDLSVTNPGKLADSSLNTPEAAPGLVTGMSYRTSAALDNIVEMTALVSGEMGHSGSYPEEGLWVRGIVQKEDVNSLWGTAEQTRWMSESGVDRIKSALGDAYNSDQDAARANLFAGLANRTLGENMCQAVIDGGAPQDRMTYFPRAEQYLTDAITIGSAAGGDGPTYAIAAHGARASVLAWQGKWDEAMQDAAQVPTDFHYDAWYSAENEDNWNDVVYETHDRYEYTVANTEFASDFNDPRVPWDTARDKNGKPALGPNGTVALQQHKYDDKGAPIPLVTGTEMRVLEAENALRKGDIAGMTEKLNEARAFYGMAPLAQPATEADAWNTLEFERGATLWLQARHLWDLTRWAADGGPAAATARVQFMNGRGNCIPISLDEYNSNPNIPKS